MARAVSYRSAPAKRLLVTDCAPCAVGITSATAAHTIASTINTTSDRVRGPDSANLVLIARVSLRRGWRHVRRDVRQAPSAAARAAPPAARARAWARDPGGWRGLRR